MALINQVNYKTRATRLVRSRQQRFIISISNSKEGSP